MELDRDQLISLVVQLREELKNAHDRIAELEQQLRKQSPDTRLEDEYFLRMFVPSRGGDGSTEWAPGAMLSPRSGRVARSDHRQGPEFSDLGHRFCSDSAIPAGGEHPSGGIRPPAIGRRPVRSDL